MSNDSFEVLAEAYTTPNKLSEMNILVYTSNGTDLQPQDILDAITDLLLVEYGPFLRKREGDGLNS